MAVLHYAGATFDIDDDVARGLIDNPDLDSSGWLSVTTSDGRGIHMRHGAGIAIAVELGSSGSDDGDGPHVW